MRSVGFPYKKVVIISAGEGGLGVIKDDATYLGNLGYRDLGYRGIALDSV
jgi:hypothetical protein